MLVISNISQNYQCLYDLSVQTYDFGILTFYSLISLKDISVNHVSINIFFL